MTQILEQVAAVSEQLLQFGINREELLLLEATILVNAGMLKYHPDNPRHVPSALLLLSHVRQASDRSIIYLQKQKDEGHVTFCELITEMLEAQNSSNDIVAPRADVIGMGT
uniref:NR LBD domain-containing protein n=1 Tax=Octopus bimaculoides TaxID=37653 RepID=A0A0L8G4A8_OCTBM